MVRDLNLGPSMVTLDFDYGKKKGRVARCSEKGCMDVAVFYLLAEESRLCIDHFEEHMSYVPIEDGRELEGYLKVCEAVLDWHFVGRKKPKKFNGSRLAH